MKKLLAFMMMAGLAAVAVTDSFALSLGANKNITVSVTTTGGTETWTATLKNVSDNSTATSQTAMEWGSITAGDDGYKIAKQYVEIEDNITSIASWKTYIYTTNGNELFGLKNNYEVAKTTRTLPLIWKVQDDTTTVPTPELRSDLKGFKNYDWKFVVEKSSITAYNTAVSEKYNVVYGNLGLYWNEGTDETGTVDYNPKQDGIQTSPALSTDGIVDLYIAVDFTNSKAETYTTTIVLDSVRL